MSEIGLNIIITINYNLNIILISKMYIIYYKFNYLIENFLSIYYNIEKTINSFSFSFQNHSRGQTDLS